MKARAHIFIKGFVQGVFFRYEVSNRANKQNVTGWVRNLRDGRVEAIFEGEKADVEAIVAFCGRGPSGAIVMNVEILWEKLSEEFKDFRIRY